MLSCGTPHSNKLDSNKLNCDLTFEVTLTWDRTERNDDSKLRAVDEILNQCFKRLRRILWSIESKAAERSGSRSTVVVKQLIQKIKVPMLDSTLNCNNFIPFSMCKFKELIIYIAACLMFCNVVTYDI